MMADGMGQKRPGANTQERADTPEEAEGRKKRKLNYLKCTRCREDKQKVLVEPFR
jgi:hypothetical protein